MPTNANLNGASYPVPNTGEPAWGPETSAYLLALATAFPQLGGTWSLLSELDLGAAFGVKALYFKSRTASPAASGIVRLANLDSVAWRNAANAADSLLYPGVAANSEAVDALYYKNLTSGLKAQLSDQPYAEYTTAAGQSIPTGATTVVNYGTLVTDTDSAVTTGAAWHFTVPANKGGIYIVSASLEYVGLTTAGSQFSVTIQKNGTGVFNLDYVFAAVSMNMTTFAMPVAGLVNCAAGDTINVGTFQSQGAPRSLVATAPQNRITIKRVA